MNLKLLANYIFFFLKDPATTEIYPFPLHDALPILQPIRLSAKQSHTEVSRPALRCLDDLATKDHRLRVDRLLPQSGRHVAVQRSADRAVPKRLLEIGRAHV